jgi:hypothetical protein
MVLANFLNLDTLYIKNGNICTIVTICTYKIYFKITGIFNEKKQEVPNLLLLCFLLQFANNVPVPVRLYIFEIYLKFFVFWFGPLCTVWSKRFWPPSRVQLTKNLSLATFYSTYFFMKSNKFCLTVLVVLVLTSTHPIVQHAAAIEFNCDSQW